MNRVLNQKYTSEKAMEMMRAKMFQLEKALNRTRLIRRILEKEPKKQTDGGLDQVIPQIVRSGKEDMQGIKDRYLLSKIYSQVTTL